FNRGRIAEYHRIKKVLSFDYNIRVARFDEIVQSLSRSEVLKDNYHQQLATQTICIWTRALSYRNSTVCANSRTCNHDRPLGTCNTIRDFLDQTRVLRSHGDDCHRQPLKSS